jgi:hypothetical protein
MSSVPLRTVSRWSLIDLGGSFPPSKRISSIRLTGGITVEIVGKTELQEVSHANAAPVGKKSFGTAWKTLAVIAVLALIIWQVYYFRELAAALLIFTILFLVFAAIAGAIYLIGRVGQKGIAIAEPAARRGLVYAEVISKKTFHRPRSAPVQ